MPRRSAEWYQSQGLPLPTYLTEGVKNYNWYIQRGLTPPAHLKVPKVVKDTVGNVIAMPTVQVDVWETDEQIEARIRTRIEVFESITDDVIRGDIRGCIVSGPPGMGKSFPVEAKLKNVEKSRIIKGHASAKGLYELLFQYCDEGSVIVLDDADSIFGDERALNLLKSALDTTEERVLSWVTGSAFGAATDDDERDIPTSFVFEGSIIFITNLDFDAMIAKGNRIAKHLEAIMSRTPYIDLMIKSRRDCLVRVKQVIRETPMLSSLNKAQSQDVVKFLEDNIVDLREISLRTALKVAMYRKSNTNWYDIAKITCCKS